MVSSAAVDCPSIFSQLPRRSSTCHGERIRAAAGSQSDGQFLTIGKEVLWLARRLPARAKSPSPSKFAGVSGLGAEIVSNSSLARMEK